MGSKGGGAAADEVACWVVKAFSILFVSFRTSATLVASILLCVPGAPVSTAAAGGATDAPTEPESFGPVVVDASPVVDGVPACTLATLGWRAGLSTAADAELVGHSFARCCFDPSFTPVQPRP